MGYNQSGGLKTLLEAKCHPRIISGASAGSLMASFISVRTDQEVWRDHCVPEGEKYFCACEEPFCVKLTRWLRHGYCFDKNLWIEQMRKGITTGDTTFLEAYQQYGRIINIAVTATSKYAPTLILNYRSTPDVVIWSAVLASSAVRNFLAPVELQVKNLRTGQLERFQVHGQTFTGGTIKNDIPIAQMSNLWNAREVTQVVNREMSQLNGAVDALSCTRALSSKQPGCFLVSCLGWPSHSTRLGNQDRSHPFIVRSMCCSRASSTGFVHPSLFCPVI
jgi:predicted acylesterase/phospholipase RssA